MVHTFLSHLQGTCRLAHMRHIGCPQVHVKAVLLWQCVHGWPLLCNDCAVNTNCRALGSCQDSVCIMLSSAISSKSIVVTFLLAVFSGLIVIVLAYTVRSESHLCNHKTDMVYYTSIRLCGVVLAVDYVVWACQLQLHASCLVHYICAALAVYRLQ